MDFEKIIYIVTNMFGGSMIEYIAVTCGLLNVVLIVKRSVWNYVFGLIMVVLYAKLFYQWKLYSDALLQIFFFIFQFYGFYYWSKTKTDKGEVVIARLTPQHLAIYVAFTVVFWLILSYLMNSYTDATHPYWDSSIAAMSVTAQILMTRRHIQNWVFWIIVDIVAIPLFIVKGLEPTAALYSLFLVLASIGLYQWSKAPKESTLHEA